MIYNIFCYGIYHKPYSIFKSKSQEFHNKNIDIFSEMILGWLYISWKCTETCGCEKLFNQPYIMKNSSLLLPITNPINQLGIFIIISRGKGAIYFSRLFFFV